MIKFVFLSFNHIPIFKKSVLYHVRDPQFSGFVINESPCPSAIPIYRTPMLCLHFKNYIVCLYNASYFVRYIQVMQVFIFPLESRPPRKNLQISLYSTFKRPDHSKETMFCLYMSFYPHFEKVLSASKLCSCKSQLNLNKCATLITSC